MIITFISSVGITDAQMLTNGEFIADATVFDNAMSTLESLYWNLLEADVYHDQRFFYQCLQFPYIRQRLLENTTLNLDVAFSQARSLESAQKNADSYNINPNGTVNAVAKYSNLSDNDEDTNNLNAVSKSDNCGKDGHFAKVCMSKPTSASLVTSSSPTVASLYPTLATITCATAPNNLKRAVISIELNNNTTEALIDTGSSESFICKNIVHELKLTVNPFKSKVSMAESSLSVDIIGYVIINNMKMRGNNYANIKLLVLKNLCADVIIGQDILKQHDSLNLKFGGSKPPLSICGLTTPAITPPPLFVNVPPDCKPVAAKSRKYNSVDKKIHQGRGNAVAK